MRKWIVLLLAAALLAHRAEAEAPIVGTASIIDGDTIEVHGTRIRLHGIDAPESSQNAIGQTAPTGAADSKRRSPYPIVSAARLFAATRATATATGVWSLYASREPRI